MSRSASNERPAGCVATGLQPSGRALTDSGSTAAACRWQSVKELLACPVARSHLATMMPPQSRSKSPFYRAPFPYPAERSLERLFIVSSGLVTAWKTRLVNQIDPRRSNRNPVITLLFLLTQPWAFSWRV